MILQEDKRGYFLSACPKVVAVLPMSLLTAVNKKFSCQLDLRLQQSQTEQVEQRILLTGKKFTIAFGGYLSENADTAHCRIQTYFIATVHPGLRKKTVKKQISKASDRPEFATKIFSSSGIEYISRAATSF